MIKIKALSGPHMGKELTFSTEINPSELLGEFIKHDWRWEIDFSQATDEETLFWGILDMGACVLAALQHSRWVRFQDIEYRAYDQSDAMEVAETIETAIATSGCMVMVESDDSHGVKIGTIAVN